MASNIEAVLAPSTASQYNRIWKKYGEFCASTGGAKRCSKTVCVFLSYLAETSPGMGGVEGARSALRHHFMVEEPEAACPTEGKEVGLVLKGLKRRFQIPVTKKSPLAKEDFFKILVAATKPDEHGLVRLCQLRLAAQVAVMFLTFARYEESAELKLEQVSREGDNLVILFKKGKNFQFGEARMSVISGDKDAVINPVDVICQYMDRLREVKGNSSGLLFPALRSTCKGDSSLDKPASYSAVLNQFKSIIKEAGVASDPSVFGLHSMRRGGVTAAVNGGASEHFVQKQMRVASGSTVRRYATVSKANLCSVSKAVLL